ncbi:MAG: hypothetical protein Q7J45_00595 [bacterium]|nr:hypothetical protein [bacterium]
MTSLSFAEKTRIGSILRELMRGDGVHEEDKSAPMISSLVTDPLGDFPYPVDDDFFVASEDNRWICFARGKTRSQLAARAKLSVDQVLAQEAEFRTKAALIGQIASQL